MSKKVVLMILDGWGMGKQNETDGIFLANTPYIDNLYKKHPFSTLTTFGEAVGLPEGQMGNSEVGHLNIGAGRVVFQDLLRINNAITDGSFYKNEALLEAIQYAKANGKKVHLLGLVSKGGVHSSQEHLYALCEMLEKEGVTESYIHAFTDGRDCDPMSGLEYLSELEDKIANSNTKVASVIGRYYAMDRDKRWERIKLAYDLMVHGKGASYSSSTEVMKAHYDKNITDEFIEPSVIADESGNPITTIEKDDVVICFNFRTDRCREITTVLTQQEFTDFEMSTMPLYYLTMTNYDKTFKGVHVAYDKENLQMTLGEVVANAGLNQIRIAETEKYAHVTFFFSGGREELFEGEDRILVNSPKVATYDLQPEMSAPEVTNKVCDALKKGEVDFMCLNYANGDMVGHTGVPEAIISACEAIDGCVEQVIETGLENNYSFIVIADHGNADNMKNEDGSPNTAHSVNPVPCILIDSDYSQIAEGALKDVAPTILKMMNVEQPAEMTGVALI